MTDALSFIRSQHGRMSDTQIMRNLGLRSAADYRELRALALSSTRPVVMPQAKPPPMPLRRSDRILRRRRRDGPRPEQVLQLVAAQSGLGESRVLAAQDAMGSDARDLAAWLMRRQLHCSEGAIRRVLGINEHVVGQCVARHDERLAQGEPDLLRYWRVLVSGRLGRMRGEPL